MDKTTTPFPPLSPGQLAGTILDRLADWNEAGVLSGWWSDPEATRVFAADQVDALRRELIRREFVVAEGG